MRILSSVTLWIFVIGSGFILGAGIYEAVAVVPFWADGAPQSLMADNPLLRVPIRAGEAFWSIVTPALGIIALAALLTSFSTPHRHMIWRVAGTSLFLLTAIVTLTYFRPSVIHMVVNHGAGRTDQELMGDAKRWVTLNWLRIGAVAASLAMSVRALLLPIS
ncbi:MAG TPA: hypothetical protein VJN69_04030 [Candidatus Acidoferrales bacterium]|nr:hypothetical protein [Candidatus Acidoferrales bacterium]